MHECLFWIKNVMPVQKKKKSRKFWRGEQTSSPCAARESRADEGRWYISLRELYSTQLPHLHGILRCCAREGCEESGLGKFRVPHSSQVWFQDSPNTNLDWRSCKLPEFMMGEVLHLEKKRATPPSGVHRKYSFFSHWFWLLGENSLISQLVDIFSLQCTFFVASPPEKDLLCFYVSFW